MASNADRLKSYANKRYGLDLTDDQAQAVLNVGHAVGDVDTFLRRLVPEPSTLTTEELIRLADSDETPTK